MNSNSSNQDYTNVFNGTDDISLAGLVAAADGGNGQGLLNVALALGPGPGQTDQGYGYGGRVTYARECIAAAQARLLSEVNQRNGTHFSKLNNAIKSGYINSEEAKNLNASSNAGKHNFTRYKP